VRNDGLRHRRLARHRKRRAGQAANARRQGFTQHGESACSTTLFERIAGTMKRFKAAFSPIFGKQYTGLAAGRSHRHQAR